MGFTRIKPGQGVLWCNYESYRVIRVNYVIFQNLRVLWCNYESCRVIRNGVPSYRSMLDRLTYVDVEVRGASFKEMKEYKEPWVAFKVNTDKATKKRNALLRGFPPSKRSKGPEGAK
ncbi:hypothetical protein LguiA_008242 [Lonicera macranthoides]